jgi:hypothetical protein
MRDETNVVMAVCLVVFLAFAFVGVGMLQAKENHARRPFVHNGEVYVCEIAL